MNRQELVDTIRLKETLLCVGLDSDINRIPSFLRENFEDPITEFNRRIISVTQEFCIAYKINIAFYEALGPKGWESLEKTMSLIPSDKFTIADAKRGDIGNTSKLYAKTFFEYFNFDAITVAPYMGEDSLAPFYEYDNKWVIILGLTSNKGSSDFQMQKLDNGSYLFEEVIRRSAQYGDSSNTMYVVGATKASYIHQIRKIIPDHFLLMPGIGKQGGDLQSSMETGLNDDFGLLINSSRSIIYAGNDENFDLHAGAAAAQLSSEIGAYLQI